MLTDRIDTDRNSPDDRAVSPVIGVILMVAITVILAAVIGVFVMDLGQSTQQTTPQASMSFDYNGSAVTVVHEGGEAFTGENTANLTITNGSSTIIWSNGTSPTDNFPVKAGDNKVFNDPQSGETVRVIWESPEGKAQVIAQFEVP